jgi:hypothetical protein
MSNVIVMRYSFALLAVVVSLGMMFGGGAIGLLLLIALVAGAISQRETLFVSAGMNFSPMLIVGAGVLSLAFALAVAVVPDFGGEARWALVFLPAYAGILTILVGTAFVVWGRSSKLP